MLAEYVALAEREEGVTFLGRLGTYRYLDMDVTIREALDTARGFLARHAERAAQPAFAVRPL
jgi:UDP-galactopyranose mutase